jgi:hypothetical protein
MTLNVPPRNIELRPITIPAPVINADKVAELLELKSGDAFLRRRPKLTGFPDKLPGLNGWSFAAVMRWINRDDGERQVLTITSSLEERYGK